MFIYIYIFIYNVKLIIYNQNNISWNICLYATQKILSNKLKCKVEANIFLSSAGNQTRALDMWVRYFFTEPQTYFPWLDF